ncbi:hypothetical protein Tco_0828349 [Tanacetum coccineum]
MDTRGALLTRLYSLEETKRKQNKEGIFISQDKYVAEMLKKFDLVNVKAAITPMETKLPLTKDEEAFDVDVHLYRSMIGSLMYLTASRPDIMYAVCVCSRFQVTPKTSHLNAVKRIFKYLKGKPNLGLWYPRDSPLDLEAFSDSDYGGSNLDRKSTTGGCQFLGQRLISWQCKKQTIVATSTTEAEYVAAAHCCGQVLWVQNQLLDYGFNFMNTKIHIDNESTICIVKNPVYHSKTKHIEIRHHFIRDCYEKKLISVEKIHTDLNVADLLTKPFDGPRFNYLVVSIGNNNTEASIRDSLQLDDALGITMLPNDELFEGMGQIGSKSGGWDQFGCNIAYALVCAIHDSEEEDPEAQGGKNQEDSSRKKLMAGAEELMWCWIKFILLGVELVSTTEGVNTGSIKLSTGDEQLSTGNEQGSTVDAKKSTFDQDKGQREGKAPMISEETPKKSKEQVLQKEASLAEAIRIAEEEELNEKQKKRKAQVQFEALHYTNEELGFCFAAKLEANAELTKSMLGSEVQGEDFAKKMVDLVNQRKKHFAEQRAKLSSFATNKFLKATKASLKRFSEELQTKTPKRMKEDKDVKAKDDESTKKFGKRRKKIARKGMQRSVDKNDSEDSDDVGGQEESTTGTETPINPVPVAMKTPTVATYKIIKQGEKGVYQIVREDGTDIVYINFGAMLKSISRDDLTELYRIVMNRYGMDGPEDKLEKGFWKCLRIMFEEPLSTDFIWSELGQQKIISWPDISIL